MATTCPKCGYTRRAQDHAPQWQCPQCEVAYVKVRAADAPEAMPRGRPAAVTKPGTPLESAMLAAGALCLVLLAGKALAGGGVDPVHALLLVPCFLCAVPAVSATFGGRLYSWNRWTMRFDAYDADAHPLLAKILYLIYLGLAVTFAGLFLLLG